MKTKSYYLKSNILLKVEVKDNNSIYNAIKKIENTDIVIIQDAARPFLKDKYIEESLKILDNTCDGAIIAVKCKDTIKVIDENGIIVETPNRNNLIAVHTPQTFKFEILKKAHQMAEEKKYLGYWWCKFSRKYFW